MDIVHSQKEIELVAILISVVDNTVQVLTLTEGSVFPHGPLNNLHLSMQESVREWVKMQTKHPLGYIEQLYTFVDKKQTQKLGYYSIYVSYLGLVREQNEDILETAKWIDWYQYLPWEDYRQGRPKWIDEILIPKLHEWIESSINNKIYIERKQKVYMCWGLDPFEWSEDYVLQRYELLYEIGYIPESPYYEKKNHHFLTGKYMQRDYRRVLASAIARLRAKIKYRPVIYELLPPKFTLYQLQQCVEALAGVGLHKQNFRRLISNQNLLKSTGELILQKRGRPAQLYQFKDNILKERELTGTKFPTIK